MLHLITVIVDLKMWTALELWLLTMIRATLWDFTGKKLFTMTMLFQVTHKIFNVSLFWLEINFLLICYLVSGNIIEMHYQAVFDLWLK